MSALATVLNLEQKRAEYMGNPQLEDGHTRIANELFEAIISFQFSSRQLKVVMAVIRKTYGFNKKQDRLALSTISEMTGVIKTHVCQTVKQLREMNVLEVDASGFSHCISLNKNYREWKSCDRISHSDQNGHSDRISHEIVTKTVTKECPKQSPQKTIKNNKDNIAADKKPSAITLAAWIEKLNGEQVMSETDPIYDYASKIGITEDMIYLCWLSFKDYYLTSKKRYTDWRAVLRNAVRGNWQKIWFIGADGKAQLTSQGRQVAMAHGVQL